MPTVSVGRDRLFALLEKDFSQDEFDELCFEFGLELDDVAEENGVVMYKIEVPANRYDLLCVEGLAQALRVFLGTESLPKYTISEAPAATMTVQAETKEVREFVVCAILRDLALDEETYQSLIDLQEKLHQNICRKRTLVAIGTHDLDTVEGPFSYEAIPPTEISFAPLRHTEEYTGLGLMELYQQDAHLKQYLPILEGRERFPYILDAKRRVMSMPPIINGAHSKISPATRNMFIECTATDLTKANIVLNILVAMFSRYCAVPFSVEPVRVEYPDGTTRITPDFSAPELSAGVNYVNRSVGISIEASEMVRHLARMQVPAASSDDGKSVRVSVPIVRPDLLAPCDIMCDVAVAYGFNRVEERMPQTVTTGKQLPLNHLSDLVRREGLAQAGFTEVLTWVTVSHDENFGHLRREDDGNTAVVLGNPKTVEFQECRTGLLPGLLKTLRENRKSKMPVRLFEVGDVVLKNESDETRACNRRRIAAVYCATNAGFEVIQGLLEHVLRTLGVKKGDGEGDSWRMDAKSCTDGAFFEGRRADVVYKGSKIGVVGWLHPEVLTNFSLSYPCSAVEIDLEVFL